MDAIRIVPTAKKYAAGVCHAVDVVARERRYLGFVEGPPLEASQAFIQALIGGAGVQLLAIDNDDAVVGWCDIFRNPRAGFRHCGQLGMGLLPHARGKGLGTQLAAATIERAWIKALERIELEVFSSNEHAVALYRKLGFQVEAVKRQARKLDGRYDDTVFMALLREDGA